MVYGVTNFGADPTSHPSSSSLAVHVDGSDSSTAPPHHAAACDERSSKTEAVPFKSATWVVIGDTIARSRGLGIVRLVDVMNDQMLSMGSADVR